MILRKILPNIINWTKSALVLSFALFFTVCVSAQTNLQQLFLSPDEEAKPWTFWYWMHGAVSKPGIKADLEAMKENGLGGAYLMSIRGPQDYNYQGAVDQLTPEWWEMVRYSMEQADRLGLKLGMHISDGFALAGGPWITPEESMQKLVWSETKTQGGRIANLQLPEPESLHNFYRDIAVFAIRDQETHAGMEPVITSNHPDDQAPFLVAEKGFRSTEPVWIQFTYMKPFTLRNVEVILFGNNYQSHRFRIMASSDGVNFREVTQLVPARHGWQNTDFQSTHAVVPVTAQFFRFYWDPTGSEPGSEDLDAAKWRPTLRLKELRLNSTPRLHQWEGKAGFVWRVAKPNDNQLIPRKDCIALSGVVDITNDFTNGILNTQLPAGNWRILRMGHTSTGHTNATGGGGKGLECDKFSTTAVKKQFDHWFGEAFRKTDPALARRVLKMMHVDSWECGSQNWSNNFPSEFRKRRGYDLMPLLPVMAGYPLQSAEFSEKVLRDVRETISELISDVFYDVLAAEASKVGCEFSAECVAPTMVADGMLHFSRVDRPMGEFWLKSPTHDKPNDMLDAIHAARIYGKNIVQAEGFTQLRTTWDEHPAMIKPLLDYNYALGINKMFFHVFVHNPYTDRRPGMTLDGIGLYYQRDQTWWKHTRALTQYMERCQALLQYGEPVTDIAVYTGEEMPRRSMLPDRLVPMLPGIFGEQRVKEEAVRLKNEGLPLRVMPVGVTHSANMADPEQWIDALNGYQYNSFNKDALMRLAKVDENGLTFGGSNVYKVVVLPFAHPLNPSNLPLSADTQKKLDQFRKAGVVFADLPWTAADFSTLGVEKDLIAPGNIAWTHRRGPEADIYFVSNQLNETRKVEFSVRIAGREPELWYPADAAIVQPEGWRRVGTRTIINTEMAPYESFFIVFRNDTNKESAQFVNGSKTIHPWFIKNWDILLERSGKQLKSDKLTDLSVHTDTAVMFYSGEMLYNIEFSFSGLRPGQRYWLDLGKLTATARVMLNGTDCGIVWTAPRRVEITQALRNGVNSLEIEVANTWANAIRGKDLGKPPYPGIQTNGRYRLTDGKLPESGLLGPVTIVMTQQ